MLKSGIPVMITKKNVLLVIDPLYPNINNATINIISFPMYILIQKATICSNSKKLPIKVPSVSEWKYIIASASSYMKLTIIYTKWTVIYTKWTIIFTEWTITYTKRTLIYMKWTVI